MSKTSEMRLILSTFPSIEKARQIGTALVELQLAACVNVIPTVESIYRWENQVCSATEALAIIKCSAKHAEALTTKLTAIHPYEVPEIVTLTPSAVHPPYLSWILASSKPMPDPD